VGATGAPVATEAVAGRFHLCSSGFHPRLPDQGVSLDDLRPDDSVGRPRSASINSHAARSMMTTAGRLLRNTWTTSDVVRAGAGAPLRKLFEAAELSWSARGGRRLHYLSGRPVLTAGRYRLLAEAGSRRAQQPIIWKSPSATDMPAPRVAERPSAMKSSPNEQNFG